MEVAPGVSTEESAFESDRVDLTGLPLERIALLPDSVLAASLRRILTDDSDPTEQYAGFQDRI
jgi:FXSXX-COOH protein